MTSNPESGTLPLTGERTVPGIERENYWFRRHEVAYEWIASTLLTSGKNIVEAGCGEGYGADLLSQGGARVTALDYDEQAIAHVQAAYPDVVGIRANLDSYPLPNDSADMVVSLQVFEHLWNIRQFLAEVKRVLVPGGLLVLSTPNRITFSPGVGRGEKPTNPFHVEEFDGDQLDHILVAAGFQGVRVNGLFESQRLADLAGRSGDIVERQIRAILDDDNWSSDLLADVASVTTGDFEIREQFENSLDLVAVGRS